MPIQTTKRLGRSPRAACALAAALLLGPGCAAERTVHRVSCTASCSGRPLELTPEEHCALRTQPPDRYAAATQSRVQEKLSESCSPVEVRCAATDTSKACDRAER